MSYVFASPDFLTLTASNLAGLGSTVTRANEAAAASTTTIVSAAEDEISTAITALFSQHAVGYQELAAQAAAFHQQFAQALTGAGGSYSLAEAANASPLAGGQ